MRSEAERPVFVTVPSYNHSAFVEQCLRSIFSQTHAPKKLFVIDDGSEDDSVNVIEKTLADCPFPSELVVRENRGLSATLNEARSHCDTEFFTYLGSDDVWLPTMLDEQTSLLAGRKRAALAFSHGYLIDAVGDIIDRTDAWSAFADGDLLPPLLAGEIFPSVGVVYRTEYLESAPWNENSILEDYELYLKLASRYQFARNQKLLGAWRQHASNTSRDIRLMVSEWIAAQDRVRDELPISDKELDDFRAKLLYESGRNLNRHGRRRDGAAIMWTNRRAAGSLGRVAADALRLGLPRMIFNANRARRRRMAIERHGNIRDLL